MLTTVNLLIGKYYLEKVRAVIYEIFYTDENLKGSLRSINFVFIHHRMFLK